MFNVVENVPFHFALEKCFKNKTSDRKERTHRRFLNYRLPAKLPESNVFNRYQIILHPPTRMGTSPHRGPHYPPI